MNNAPKFNVGDWIFCNLALHRIEEMRGDDITTITDGFFSKGSSSWNDEAFHLDIRIKVISANFEGQKDKLHREGNRQLNFPDIHRWLVKKWVAACRVKDDTETVNAAISELDEWTHNILNRCQELNREEVGGIRLFR